MIISELALRKPYGELVWSHRGADARVIGAVLPCVLVSCWLQKSVIKFCSRRLNINQYGRVFLIKSATTTTTIKNKGATASTQVFARDNRGCSVQLETQIVNCVESHYAILCTTRSISYVLIHGQFHVRSTQPRYCEHYHTDGLSCCMIWSVLVRRRTFLSDSAVTACKRQGLSLFRLL